MGVLGNIYCIPRNPGSVQWSVILNTLAERALVRPPYRSGTPFRKDSDRSDIIWPENWIDPVTLRSATTSLLPLRDFQHLPDALAHIANAADATITMDAPCASFQLYPDTRDLHGAVALYKFRDGAHFRIGVPQDYSDVANEFPELANQSTTPKWEGTITELLWVHGKCVPREDEFVGSPLERLVLSHWPGYRLLADEFL